MQSNCSSAIKQDIDKYLVSSLNALRLPRYGLTLPGLSQASVKLKSVNAGQGTTGTRTINSIICTHFNTSSLHYALVCNADETHTAMVQWTVAVVVCTSATAEKCLSADILNSYPVALTELLLTREFASDFPVGEILPDILHFAPDLAVLLTLRDPKIWSTRRAAAHSNSPICHPNLWDSPDVLHPFDIISCLHKEKFVSDALIPVEKLIKMNRMSKAISKLHWSYRVYNTVIMSLTKAANVPSLPLCLWDSVTTEADELTSNIRMFWKMHSITAAIASRNGGGEIPHEMEGYKRSSLKGMARTRYVKRKDVFQSSSRRGLLSVDISTFTGGELPQLPDVGISIRPHTTIMHYESTLPYLNVQYCILFLLLLLTIKLLFFVPERKYAGLSKTS